MGLAVGVGDAGSCRVCLLVERRGRFLGVGWEGRKRDWQGVSWIDSSHSDL